ncbi:hypothetical protein [Massilia endophytica]|uniref:hypothetical protein n=1 Tax=Massilia endophytica TaxID=2899220 RepID=UPI001E4A4F74|nr:hypothetical protein [Massilia endophytica]UGQ45109.1 hypothetical protein LSQ66_15050 [Massilia endophytica]
MFLVVVGIVAIVFCVAALLYGQNIPFANQWPLFEALRTTASIIFAVVGAWLAIIYPERLKLSFKKSGDRKSAGSDNVGLLLTPAVHSTIILVCLLLIGIAAPLIKQIPGILQHVVFLRGISFFLLTILTLWQVAIVVIAVFPAAFIKDAYDAERAIAHAESLRNSLATVVNGDETRPT